MAEITVAKAQPTGPTYPTPDAHIHITGELPSIPSKQNQPGVLDLNWMAARYDEQAQQIHEALYESLPGGTYDRLLGHMLARKASHFRVSYKRMDES